MDREGESAQAGGLRVCTCSPRQFSNLTIKKIPKTVLKKCEWGHDDYSLEIQNLPKAPIREDEEEESVKPRRKFGKGKRKDPKQQSMFDMEIKDE